MRKYNLVDEPWICLFDKSGKEKKDGLKGFFLNSHKYMDLCGDTRMQDMAVLRILIAVSVTLLFRYDEKGKRKDLADWIEADERIQAVWRAGRFPGKAVEDYFERWHDRFWLFDEEHPFMQVPANKLEWYRYENSNNRNSSPGGTYPFLANGIRMGWGAASVLNGLVLASANKSDAPFKTLYGEEMTALPFDEAARWMLFYTAYADASYGKRQAYKEGDRNVSANAEMTLPAKGILLAPYGNNLFETLLFCSVLYHGDSRKLWGSCRPLWEEDGVTFEKESKKPVPDDLARMYTQQARRLFLVEQKEKVIGAFISAGESYIPDQVQADPMLVMESGRNAKTGEEYIVPAKMKTPFWGRLCFVFDNGGKYRASVIGWMKQLLKDVEKDGAADWYDRLILFRTACIEYGQVGCSYQTLETEEFAADQAILLDEDLHIAAREYVLWASRLERILERLEDGLSACGGIGEIKKKNEKDRLLCRMYRDEAAGIFKKYLTGKLDRNEIGEMLLTAARAAVDRYIKMNKTVLVRGKKGTEKKEGMYIGKVLTVYERAFFKLEKEVMGNNEREGVS